jgi:hypothetical protein
MSQQIAKQVGNRHEKSVSSIFSTVARPGYCQTGDDYPDSRSLFVDLPIKRQGGGERRPGRNYLPSSMTSDNICHVKSLSVGPALVWYFRFPCNWLLSGHVGRNGRVSQSDGRDRTTEEPRIQRQPRPPESRQGFTKDAGQFS